MVREINTLIKSVTASDIRLMQSHDFLDMAQKSFKRRQKFVRETFLARDKFQMFKLSKREQREQMGKTEDV